MKLMKLFTLLALFGISNAALAGTVKFVNTTNDRIYGAIKERSKGFLGSSTQGTEFAVEPRDAYDVQMHNDATVTFDVSSAPIPSNAPSRYTLGSGSRNYTIKVKSLGNGLLTQQVIPHD